MEQVVLLTEHGYARGVADKATVHDNNTRLHLAFSCYVINTHNELLLTRRALTKRTWPGAWTNSCCGHPAPGESLTDAVTRRLTDELGIQASKVDLILPAFRYHAVAPDGVVENEMCPVMRVLYDGPVHPNPAEVDTYRWIPWTGFAAAVTSGSFTVSPWCSQQLNQLRLLGPNAKNWPVASADALPTACQHR